ncbi:unnamed protein product [Dovyalis caffra]|uniref:Uncharacterized protein n=1 Tax=Dovyalis caffra TaxID=77055 RepID=A0AAV1RDD1_9ROSI|nr:unnamed protein product [Dovyalis caffra]
MVRLRQFVVAASEERLLVAATSRRFHGGERSEKERKRALCEVEAKLFVSYTHDDYLVSEEKCIEKDKIESKTRRPTIRPSLRGRSPSNPFSTLPINQQQT